MDYTWLFGTFAKCEFLAGVYIETGGWDIPCLIFPQD